METKMKKPELLLPASCLEVLKIAVTYGADDVYIGGEAFSLRAKAKNFSKEDMKEGIAFAHKKGAKVYVTANIFAHNEDIKKAEDYFRELGEIKPDAILMSDPGLFDIARRVCPQIDIHISTQANNTNYGTYNFWYRNGVRRVVSARELSLKEIKEIRDNIPGDMEIESFIHGAMCISYSGRCLLSNYFTGRDANQGACTHPCRWKYQIVEETRPGEYMPVYENERGTYIFNSKDLCMIQHIPDLFEAGVDSFKIEGRMKTALYVASAARSYRMAIDDYMKDPVLYEKNRDLYLDLVSDCTYRDYTTGFFYGRPDSDAQIYGSNTYYKDYTYLGFVRGLYSCGEAIDDPEMPDETREAVSEKANGRKLVRLIQKNKFSVGEMIEIMKPDGRNVRTEVLGIFDSYGNSQESAPHPEQEIFVLLDEAAEELDILRREEL